MLSDKNRSQGFATAIDRIVQPGDVVLDLGAGTGLLTYFAAKKARHVYAIEADPEVARAARRYIDLNNLSDRVTLVEGLAEEFAPPEPIDTVVCEMLHVGLLVEQQVPVLNTINQVLARLYPGHRVKMIPSESVSYCQLLNASFDFYGFQAPMVRFGNTYVADSTITPLSALTRYHHADFREQIEPKVHSEITIPATLTGTVNAVRLLTQVVLWFDGTLPLGQQLIDWYLHFLVIPLPNTFAIEAGQNVRVTIDCRLGGPIEELGVRAVVD